MNQAEVVKAGRRVFLALALSLVLFLPVAYASNTITLTSPNPEFKGQFGFSVAVNQGDPIVVVGAPFEKASGVLQAGHAYTLDTSTGSITTLTSPSLESFGFFGYSVAVSGTTVVVGAVGEDGNAGNAYVFDTTGGSPIKLTSPGPLKTGGEFGYSVSVSGTTVVVGAPFESAGGKGSAGNAYVFDATDGSFITKLTSPTPEDSGFFGFSVAVSGTTVVVGAPTETGGVPPKLQAGNAYVFDTTGGSPIATLTSPDARNFGGFGFSVAVSGTTVVVGAPFESAGAPAQFAAGHAYVFDSTIGFLTPTKLTSPYAQSFGQFGSSVAVGSATVVVGAPDETANGQLNAGHAYSFDASTGFLTTTLTSPNPQAGLPTGEGNTGNFGLSVSVSESDPTVVVGAPFESGGGSIAAGHAYIFS